MCVCVCTCVCVVMNVSDVASLRRFHVVMFEQGVIFPVTIEITCSYYSNNCEKLYENKQYSVIFSCTNMALVSNVD